MNAEERINVLNVLLSVFNRAMHNFGAIIGDNCHVNQSINNKLNIPLIGCSSHGLQLAVNDLLPDHEKLLKKVHNLIVKLRTPLVSAALRRMTHLKPKLRNETGWSSTFQMLKCHVELWVHVKELGCEELDDLVLTQSGERKMDQVHSVYSIGSCDAEPAAPGCNTAHYKSLL